MSPNTKNSIALTLPSDVEVRITRSFDAPRTLVWAAFTECKHLQRWMTGWEGWTMPICEMDLRPGGAIVWGWRKAEGEEMQITGTVREVSPPERLVFNEGWGEPWPETLDTMEFTEHEGKTTVTLTMLFPSQAARDSAMETGMSEGMEVSYARLDGYLRSLS